MPDADFFLFAAVLPLPGSGAIVGVDLPLNIAARSATEGLCFFFFCGIVPLLPTLAPLLLPLLPLVLMPLLLVVLLWLLRLPPPNMASLDATEFDLTCRRPVGIGGGAFFVFVAVVVSDSVRPEGFVFFSPRFGSDFKPVNPRVYPDAAREWANFFWGLDPEALKLGFAFTGRLLLPCFSKTAMRELMLLLPTGRSEDWPAAEDEVLAEEEEEGRLPSARAMAAGEGRPGRDGRAPEGVGGSTLLRAACDGRPGRLGGAAAFARTSLVFGGGAFLAGGADARFDGLGVLRVGGAAGNVARGTDSSACTAAGVVCTADATESPCLRVAKDPGGTPYNTLAASEATSALVDGLFWLRAPPLPTIAEADRECFGVGFLRGGGPNRAAGFLIGGGGGTSRTDDPAIGCCREPPLRPPPRMRLLAPPPAPLPSLEPPMEKAATLIGAVAVR